MPQFSRPVYEGLPWLYIICGVATLAAAISWPPTGC